MDLGPSLIYLWSKRLLIASVTLVFLALALAAAFLLEPRYRATAVLVPVSHEAGGGGLLSALGQLGGIASMAGIGFGSGDSETQEAIAVLESRQFTEAFITDENLMPTLFPRRWDAATKRWRGDKADWPTLADGFRHFHNRIRSVSRDKDTGLVTLSIEWSDPARAADWANKLVDRLNAEMRSRAISRTSSSLDYLDKELTGTLAIETRQAISRLVEAQINQRMLANVTREYAFRFVDRALPPDRNDEVWPPKVLFVVGALLGGLVLSVGCLLLSRALRPEAA
jgi:uncharacterized protein involved in exopolysaccharide biosynthesis